MKDTIADFFDHWENWQKYVGATLIVAIIAFFGLFAFENHVQSERQDDYSQASRQLNAAKNKLASKKEEARQQAIVLNSKSSNKVTAANALQQQATTKATTAATRFFNAMYSYDNQSEYAKRAVKAKKYASSAVLKNTKIFNSGKGTSGDDYIDNTGLHSAFISAKTSLSSTENLNDIAGLVTVTYSGWYEGSSAGTGSDLYLIHFNYYSQKITKLVHLSRLDNND